MKIFSDINLDDLSEEDMSDLATITAKIRNLLISEDDYKKCQKKHLMNLLTTDFI